jgi:rSAM/selenodomain-associated transferase 1
MTVGHDCLVVFARAPELGRVKTRLAADLGPARALAIYRELTARVIEVVRDSADRVVVTHAPADAEPSMRAWLGETLSYAPQCDGDLGERMEHAFATSLAEGAERVVIIGTDCPTITAETVDAAFAALDDADVVFGPAADGGYYLVGARAVHPFLFRAVPWSSDRTLGVSLDRAREAGLRVSLLPPMRDVDTAADWDAYDQGRPARG